LRAPHHRVTQIDMIGENGELVWSFGSDEENACGRRLRPGIYACRDHGRSSSAAPEKILILRFCHECARWRILFSCESGTSRISRNEIRLSGESMKQTGSRCSRCSRQRIRRQGDVCSLRVKQGVLPDRRCWFSEPMVALDDPRLPALSK